MSEDKLLVRIAEMYYQENKTQSQISRELGIHRTTISRLLKQSRDEGIVRIAIKYDKAGTYSIEQQLEANFGLFKAIVIPTATDMTKKQKNLALAEGLSIYLKELLHDKMTIGFSWGETMSAVSEKIPSLKLKDIICVPMIGGPSGRLISDYHVNTIAYDAAKKLNGKALMIDSPAILETSSLKEELMKSDFNQEFLSYWDNLDIAIMGVGSPILMNNQTWLDFYGKDIVEKIKENGMVGDVVSRFFNSTGDHIESELDDRIIGISLDKLRKCPYRIGIAESKSKVAALIGALRGRYINILVTTEDTAKDMLKHV
ncbi:sugar-binding transcriptional regulator [Streptococcus parauberis]|uniref:sugar-binding transcriptional regulator n=1 Tax=Streptococcus parauberis TaxID=1348 RepID=UPI00020CBCC0|nr:sugar-binding transcriptional regulator [Streptococcus parauberis]AEF25977.1 transcriptional regulator, DeoR family [Streptococcus parauberis KCTC 11537]UWM90817.1 sugar-binding transcriptional regulator [Streptococcus parauberis]WEM62970.1 sugar-binding transcriptional regulator [Streptococcus parauberis]GAJ61322.1 Cro/CI family transcriptional regulator-like protein [Streptococcus parauberis]